ncbi:MAG: polyprenyl synthetase family protein [Planctomycetota bacterium]|nr:polyprenyl synthetase family protein [Planctomycetota bacterium]
MSPQRTNLARARAAEGAPEPLAFALERLWPVIGIERDTPQGRAMEAALLEPARSMLERGGKRFRGHLVELCWQIAGGEGPCPETLPAIIEIIHAGTLIVDDIEDESTERRAAPTVHELFGVPLALNAGNWLYFWALDLLGDLQLPPAIELDLHHRLGRMLVQGHAGQALDLDADILRLPQPAVAEHVEHMSRLKTGSFMSAAAGLGAAAAQAPAPVIAAVEHFGLALGGGLQMLDDLANLGAGRQGAKRYEDLRHGRANWPWAWMATQVEAPDWAASMDHLRAVRVEEREAASLAEALLERVGPFGRASVHALLAGAFDDLRAAIGPHPLLASFRSEIERLEASHA